jgi:mRNA (guanine-N7-)-methyltransferase
MMSSKKRAQRFFQTVSQLLEINGNLIATTIDARVVMGHLLNLGVDLHFDTPEADTQEIVVRTGNGACQLRFEPEIVKRIFTETTEKDSSDKFGLEYTFTLVEGSDHAAGVGDAVNLPEWLTPLPVLEALANEAGLVLEYCHNFHEFFLNRSNPSSHAGAHSSLYNMKVLNRNGSISADEWEVSRLYTAIKFRKVRETTMELDDSDDDESTGEEDLADIDPALKSKLLPMAMMKAKKGAGADAWKLLSAEEKQELIEAELKSLAASKS